MTTSTENLGERLSRIEGGYEHLATKADVADVRAELTNVKAELKADIAELRTELKADVAEANGKVDRLTIEMARMETRLLLRMGGLVVAAVAAAVGFSRLLG